MTACDFQFILFPHTTLSERDCRHLSLFFPSLYVAEVARPVGLPNWTQERFQGFPLRAGDEEREQILCLLKAYEEFAGLHGETSMLAALNHDWVAREARESRFCIQSRLKGRSTEEMDLKSVLFHEASIFLEVARNLDEHEKDLTEKLVEIEGLEDQFREILGISQEDELDDELQGLSPPLAPDRNALSFMLPKRMECWLRLFVNALPKKEPVLVSVTPDAPEDLIDRVTAERERTGRPLQPRWLSLTPIPSLDRLDAESCRSLLGELLTSGLLEAFWGNMEKVLKEPESSVFHQALEMSSREMASEVERLMGSRSASTAPDVGLTLAILEGCPLHELWTTLDKDPRNVWPAAEEAGKQARSLLIYLSYT